MAILTRRAVAFSATAFLAQTAYAHDNRPLVLMVGHADSPSSLTWCRREGADWMKTPQFQRVKFEKIDVPRSGCAMDPAMWPQNRRWIIEAFWSLHGSNGVPSFSEYDSTWDDMDVDAPPVFYVTAHRQLVEFALGLGGWPKMPLEIAKLISG